MKNIYITYIHVFPLAIFLLDKRNQLDKTIYYTYTNITVTSLVNLPIRESILQALYNE